MTPIQYCYEKIAAHGSPVYYSIKKVRPEKRNALIIVHAFYQELEDVLLKNSDHEIAYQQLRWWRGEMLNISQGLATHPVAKAMQDAKLTTMSVYLDMIDGMEQTLASPSFETFEDLIVHIMRTGGVRELAGIDLLQLPQQIPTDMIYQCSIVIELVHFIQYLRHYIRRGFIMYPRDELQQFHISTELLHAFKTTSSIKNFLAFQAEKIRRAYQKVNDSLTPSIRELIKHLLARCDLSMATLDKIQESDFTVLEHFIQLTPLKMWWVAYKV